MRNENVTVAVHEILAIAQEQEPAIAIASLAEALAIVLAAAAPSKAKLDIVHASVVKNLAMMVELSWACAVARGLNDAPTDEEAFAEELDAFGGNGTVH